MFNFRNSTPEVLQLAFQWRDPSCEGGWRTRDWFMINPGETKTVFGEDLRANGRHFYYYAESSGPNSYVWEGEQGVFDTCTPISRFDWCLDTCNNNPFTRTLSYQEVSTGNNASWTRNLLP